MSEGQGVRLLRVLLLFVFAWTPTRLQSMQAQAIEIPVTWYYSYKSFDECGWTCDAVPPCFSWEYVWVCYRNPGYEAGGDVLQFNGS